MTNDITTGVEMPEAVDLANPNDEKACYGHTADQLLAYGAACRVKALEDAAKYLEDIHHTRLVKFAAAIRALKGETP